MNPYSGTSSLAKVLRFSAVGAGLMYGAVKMSWYKSQAAKAAKQAHH